MHTYADHTVESPPEQCPAAVAFHSAMALKEGVDPEDVRAIRERRLPADAKLAALSSSRAR